MLNMQLSGTVSKITEELKKMNLPTHTKLVVNGKQKVWYAHRLSGIASYEKRVQDGHNIPPERAMIASAKQSDKLKGIEFHLSTGDVEEMRRKQRDLCYYCKTPMDGVKRQGGQGMTLERRDNSIGHTTDNCVLACWDCNCGCQISRLLARCRGNPVLKAYMMGALDEMG
jgi:hypothetical protein